MTNSQTIAYTRCISAFLNSSGFHLAISNLAHIKIKTPTTTTHNSENIVFFANLNNQSILVDCIAVFHKGSISPVEKEETISLCGNAKVCILVKKITKDSIHFIHMLFIFLIIIIF